MQIRPAHRDDAPLLREVEIRAGAPFAAIGMPEIAGDDPGLIDEDDVVWVAEQHGEIVGYVLVLVVDAALHVEQVSVVPEVRGQRIGAALIDRAAAHARERGLSRLTLTTFRDVPWNAPYYERLGFTVLDDLGPELATLVERERVAIPGDAPRVAMQRDL